MLINTRAPRNLIESISSRTYLDPKLAHYLFANFELEFLFCLLMFRLFYINFYRPKLCEIGPNLRLSGPSTEPSGEFAYLFSLLKGGSPRAASGGVIMILRAPLPAGTPRPRRLESDPPGGQQQTGPRRSPIRGALT